MWTATYDELPEVMEATGATPEEAVENLERLLQTLPDYVDPGEPLELFASGVRLFVADGPSLLGRVFLTGQPFVMG